MVSMRSIFEYLWQNPYRVIGFVACCVILAVRTWRGRKKECKRLWDRVALPAMVCVIAFINPIPSILLDCSGVDFNCGRVGFIAGRNQKELYKIRSGDCNHLLDFCMGGTISAFASEYLEEYVF